MNKLHKTIILDRNPKTTILNISSKDGVLIIVINIIKTFIKRIIHNSMCPEALYNKAS